MRHYTKNNTLYKFNNKTAARGGNHIPTNKTGIIKYILMEMFEFKLFSFAVVYILCDSK